MRDKAMIRDSFGSDACAGLGDRSAIANPGRLPE
jgi:hypothetical protein